MEKRSNVNYDLYVSFFSDFLLMRISHHPLILLSFSTCPMFLVARLRLEIARALGAAPA